MTSTIRIPDPHELLHVEVVMTREDGSRIVLDAPTARGFTMDWSSDGAGSPTVLQLTLSPRGQWFFTDTSTASTWRPTEMWRSVSPKGKVRGTSPDEEAVRETARKKDTVQRLWVLPEVTQWRDA